MGIIKIQESSKKHFEKDIPEILGKFKESDDPELQKQLKYILDRFDLELGYYCGEPRGLFNPIDIKYQKRFIWVNDYWLAFVSGYRAK